ncbi:MAG TPA: Gfo/Idh/MocA family oxidoreductase [Woeseiaceae bacterium]|nr:Gfo/Idh/MocA family oxidoreductase [Woeseiaceae bacterium]
MSIRIGIVGAGRMGLTHLAILNTDPRVEISSVADTSRTVLDVLSRHVKCRTFRDFGRLVDEDRPDALVVCTPPTLHENVLRAALERGIHVFCEKPFTVSARLAHELADAFESAGLVNQVGYVNRFNDVFMHVRELLDAGILGRVQRYRTEMASATVTRPQNGSDGGWRGTHETGGGVTYEMASHAIDLVNFFLEPPRRVVGTVMSHVYSRTVEDIVSTTLLHDDGCTGTLFVDWCNRTVRKPANRIELAGEKGRLTADQYSVRIWLEEAQPDLDLHEGWNTRHVTDVFRPVPFYVRGNEFTRQLRHFVDNVEGNRSNGHCTFRMGAETHDVIESMFEDGRRNGGMR